MNLKPKIKYQLFLYNYYKFYIQNHLWESQYDIDSNAINKQCEYLISVIKQLEKINEYEKIRYNKSRGKHRKHLMFLTEIRNKVIFNKKEKLCQLNKLIHLAEINKTKQFFYKNYDDYFSKHIKQYSIIQKIKIELKNKYDNKVRIIYNHIFHPITINDLLFHVNLDKVENILERKINMIMNNVF